MQNRDTLCPRGTLNVQFDVSLLVPQTIRADKEPRKAAAAKKSHALSAPVSAENMKSEVAKDLSALLYSQVHCTYSFSITFPISFTGRCKAGWYRTLSLSESVSKTQMSHIEYSNAKSTKRKNV